MSTLVNPVTGRPVHAVPVHAGAPGSAEPTPQLAVELQYAFDELNRRLGLHIKPTMIRIARERPVFAWFMPNAVTRFDGMDVIHEIAVNDTYFAARTLFDTLASLGAVMVEAFWYDRGKAVKDGYRHVWWAHKMETIGLMPSASGERGGARTGRKVSQYIIEGGRFQRACEQLLENGFLISWFSRYAAAKPAGMSSAPSSLKDTQLASAPPVAASPAIEELTLGELAKAEARAILMGGKPSEMPEERLRGAFDRIMWERDPTKATQVKYSCNCDPPNHVWGRKDLRLRCEAACKQIFTKDTSKREYGMKKARPKKAAP